MEFSSPVLTYLQRLFLQVSLPVLFLSCPLEADWPQYRGPEGRGTAPGSPPVEWNQEQNIAWKTDIPGCGWSSPVTDSHLVWLTTALDDGHSLRAIAVDASNGAIRWNTEVFAPQSPDPVNSLNSHATPTPALAGNRVFVSFGNMGNACLDALTGKIIWRNTELKLDHKEGAASSPIVWGNEVFLECDGTDHQFIAALDRETGRLAWKTERSADLPSIRFDLRKAYCTPVVTTCGNRHLLLSVGSRRFYAYDPHSGRELWYVNHPGYNNAQPAQVMGDLVFWGTGWNRGEIYAVHLDPQATGDISNSHLAWKTNRDIPRMPCPLLLADRLFMVSDDGVATTLDFTDGKQLWRQKILGKCYASPVLADGRIYVFDSTGKCAVLSASPPHSILAENQIPDGCMASPAIMGDSLLVRTRTSLYRIASVPVP